MNNIFFKIWFSIFALFITFAIAQEQKADHSEGALVVNSQTIPIKIYASTNLSKFANFADLPNGTLVITNDSNLEPGNRDRQNYNESTIIAFKKNGFQFLDKKFQPYVTDDVNTDNVAAVKYLYKSDKKLNESDNVSLKTPFKIWDPSVGIKLGNFTLHFYSLMFVLAFGLGYVVMTKIFQIDNVNLKYLEPLFTITLVGTILGARLGHVIFYEPELFKDDFWSVFLPIRTNPEFEFTGFSGLASHGAAVMLTLTTLYYAYKIIKKNPFWVYDRLGIVVALGGGFVRIGNFFNSEIIGKPTPEGSPFAILFPQMSSEYGLTVPRYPTQLFEATGYFLLFALLWFLYRKTDKKYQQGWLFGLFFLILWSIRFFVEFLKEPQGTEKITMGILNTGQVLSIPLIIAGIIVMWYSKKMIITPEENGKPE